MINISMLFDDLCALPFGERSILHGHTVTRTKSALGELYAIEREKQPPICLPLHRAVIRIALGPEA